ncbi:MAG: hypothetical protein R3Y11_01735 [Pseudomonadota bacterium]
MEKDLIENNLEIVKDLLENVYNDNAIIMIASTTKEGMPVLDTMECKPDMSKDIVCMLLSAALVSTRNSSGVDGEVTQGYFLEPVISTVKVIQ